MVNPKSAVLISAVICKTWNVNISRKAELLFLLIQDRDVSHALFLLIVVSKG